MFIVKYKKIFISISVVFVGLALASIFYFGLKQGIDFKGGALSEISYPDGRPDVEVLKSKIEELNLGEFIIQPLRENDYLVKTRDLTEAERSNLFASFTLDNTKQVEEKSFTSIGPSVGHELKNKAITAISIVVLAIILFIAFAFRKVSKPVSSWKYGLVAIVALVHDVIITAGVFALLGHFKGAEVDTMFVVALLTVLGLSVNDTIVVFDRIRENLKNNTTLSLSENVGKSISSTFSRSINTSMTVILALVALFLIGPESTQNFALTLIAGMFFGTYSSIFLASPLLVLIESWQKKGKHSK